MFALALGLLLVPATAATATTRQFDGADELLITAAGWHGRAIQRPHEHDASRGAASRSPHGWSAGTAALGAGVKSPSGSRRVREVQRRLLRLGYRTGPADGIYGPRTRAAVGWFQRKHGLPLDGRATLATVGHLRERTGAARAPQRRPGGEAGEADAPAPSPVSTPVTGAASTSEGSDNTSSPWLAYAALAFLIFHIGVIGYVVGRRWWRPIDVPMVPALVSQSVPESNQPERAPRAVGYIRLAPGAPSASFHAQAAAIETGCLERRMKLVSLVSDLEPEGRAPQQPTAPALAQALGQLESGYVDRLVVSRLDHLGRTREELAPLLESIAESDGALVVLDRDLDTASLPDPLEPDELLRQSPERRTRFSTTIDTHAIDTHIASMLDEGLSPQDIAEALNDEPVPPPLGAQWGSGGVQAALLRREHAEKTERFDD